MAMRGRSQLDRPGLLDQGEEGRVHAGRAIRGSFRRALPTHRFPDSEVLANRAGRLITLTRESQFSARKHSELVVSQKSCWRNTAISLIAQTVERQLQRRADDNH